MLHKVRILSKKSRIKRLSSVILTFLISISLTFPAMAQEFLIYQETKNFPITRGATYEERTKFTSNGWQKIHILRVDLSSDNIDVDTLIGNNGLSKRSPLSNMAKENNAIAAINGDFFLMSNPSAPIGVQIRDGKLISSPSNRNNMAEFRLTFDNIPEIVLSTFDGKLIAPNGHSFTIGGINKISGKLNPNIFIYTPEFGDSTPIQNENVTFAITSGKNIVDICNNKTVPIPSDGIVVMGRNEGANFIKNNFNIGDDIEFDINISPDIANIKAALGGGAILVKDGVIPSKFSHVIHGVQPRTAIGFTKDRKNLIMVAVDGRQTISRGLTMQELAKLMKDLGAYNALNLDGGGSTTMVVRPLAEKNTKVINNLSEGTQRYIANGIGIFTKNPPGTIKGFKIDADSFNVPRNGTRTFNIKAYDENYNPIDVDLKDINWDVSDNLGYFENNVFYATGTGTGHITASFGNIKQTQDIKILEDTATLSIEPSRIKLKPGEEVALKVTAIDKQGFSAPLEKRDIKWKVIGDIGIAEDNKFIASYNTGKGAIIAGFDDNEAYALVNVGLEGEGYDTSLLPAEKPLIDEAKKDPEADSIKVDIAKDYKASNGKYTVKQIKDTLFIYLNAQKGSLRTTNPYQWSRFLQDMDTKAPNYKNVVIVTNRAPEAFTDIYEGQLFQKLLSQYKAKNPYNLWQITVGAPNFSTQMHNGVRYMKVPDRSSEVILGVKPGELTYKVYPSLTVFVNGNKVKFDVLPYINNDGRTMVPLRFISENLGSEVAWNNKERSVTIKQKDKNIKLFIDKNTAYVNNNVVTFDTKPQLKGQRTMVPLRFISEVLGAEVQWDQDARTIKIKK